MLPLLAFEYDVAVQRYLDSCRDDGHDTAHVVPDFESGLLRHVLRNMRVAGGYVHKSACAWCGVTADPAVYLRGMGPSRVVDGVLFGPPPHPRYVALDTHAHGVHARTCSIRTQTCQSACVPPG
jgi:hypothetical protein